MKNMETFALNQGFVKFLIPPRGGRGGVFQVCWGEYQVVRGEGNAIAVGKNTT